MDQVSKFWSRLTTDFVQGDWEFVSQHPLSGFKACEVRNVQHRKQGPSLPTLLLDFKPDSVTERQRKRRSSRTPGLSSKDPWAGTLLFRTVAEERFNIYDWQVTIKPQLTPDDLQESQESLNDFHSPISPISPGFTSFTNPFAPRDNRSSTSMVRPEMQHRSSSNQTISTYPHAPRDRPSAMISPSPSLRSRRSDLSSQGSSLQPPMGYSSNHTKNHSPGLPSDLPSPASVYDNQFIEGWTSAQGRSSALSSHTRGSNSIASAVAPPIGSTPPGPRETILDRAFQMRCIPGSDRLAEREDGKISSIARFEALMREVDERKRQKSTSSSQGVSKWELDEESEDDSSSEKEKDEDDDDDDDETEDDENSTTEGLEISDSEPDDLPTPAQRALEYISGRRTPLPTSRPLSPTEIKSPPVPFLNPQAMTAFHGSNSTYNGGGLRPRTGTTSTTRSASSSKPRPSRPTSLALPSRSVSAAAVPSLKDVTSSANNHNPNSHSNLKPETVKRRSSTSAKRLSFTEFAKRLSSSSSLLLVQTNASSGSGRERDGSRSRRESEEFEEEERNMIRGAVNPRGGAGAAILNGSVANGERNGERDKRCGWRGSVGVFGGEGGFL